MTFRADFERTLRLSRFAARVAHARPALVEALESAGAPAIVRADMEAALAQPGALASHLRQLRERTLLTLAHRDLNGLASLDEVFATMTALAEVSVAAAAA